MSRPINIAHISQIENVDECNKFIRYQSNDRSIKGLQSHELKSVKKLIWVFNDEGFKIKDYEGFYICFSPVTANKEFDLIKYSDDLCINIELKSDDVDKEKIKKQLIRNKYYLKHIAKKILLYTYVSSNDSFYCLQDDNNLVEVDVSEIVINLNKIRNNYDVNLSKLFEPSAFLVSPINDTVKFFGGNYYLTNEQERIKNYIMKIITEKRRSNDIFRVSGDAGTGKTLLMYDIIKNLTKQGFNILLVHCGKSNESWKIIELKLKGLTINEVKSIRTWHQSYYDRDLIIIDESQRIYPKQRDTILKKAKIYNTPVIFCFDKKQTLSNKENDYKNYEHISDLMKQENDFTLKGKIRINKNLWNFIQWFTGVSNIINFNIDSDMITIIKSNSSDYTINLIKFYKDNGYCFINFTKSVIKPSPYDRYQSIESTDTHKVIGQEYDNILIVINEEFFYAKDGLLKGRTHPNPNYIYEKLLYQGLTRARCKIAIIIENNDSLFESCMSRLIE